MAAVFAVLSAAPARAVAQEANPSAPVHSAAQSEGQAALPTQPGHVKDEEAEEHNLFRHTALVQKISDSVFHDNASDPDPAHQAVRTEHIEKTARAFEWINSAIIIFAIIIPLGRILPRIIRRRSETLKQNLEQARKSTADANARLSAVEAQMARLDDEIAKIRVQVEEESRQDEVRIKATIQEESARIVSSAEQEIAAATAQATRGLRNFAADLAIDQAARQLILTPETDRALIAEFVATTAGNGAAKGGKK